VNVIELSQLVTEFHSSSCVIFKILLTYMPAGMVTLARPTYKLRHFVR
jgi:hypothetical protein